MRRAQCRNNAMGACLLIVLTFVLTVTCQSRTSHSTEEHGGLVIGHVSRSSFGPGSLSVSLPGRGTHDMGRQDYPLPPGAVRHEDGSIYIERIDGLSLPDNSLSIGHGRDSVYGDGGPGADVNVDVKSKDPKKNRQDSKNSARNLQVAAGICYLLALLSIYI